VASRPPSGDAGELAEQTGRDQAGGARPWWSRTPLARLSVLPGVFSVFNATAWLYWTVVLIPAATIGRALVRWARGQAGSFREAPAIAAATLCLLAGVFVHEADHQVQIVTRIEQVLEDGIVVRGMVCYRRDQIL